MSPGLAIVKFVAESYTSTSFKRAYKDRELEPQLYMYGKASHVCILCHSMASADTRRAIDTKS